MCKVIEDMRAEERKEVSVKMARRMLKDGTLSIEKIAEYADLPLEEVKELAEQKTA